METNQSEGMQPFCTEEEARAVAALKNHPGFITLLRLLENNLRNIEELMVRKSDGAEALKLLRYWQFMRSVLETFILGPEKIGQELELQRQMASLEEDPTKKSYGLNVHAGTQGFQPPPELPGKRRTPIVPIR